jgi:Tfp pilus assembly PilM family ATPase
VRDATGIGLHLCGERVRCAELRRAARHMEIVRLTSFTADKLDGAIAPPNAADANGTHCVASVPTADVMTRCWSFPDADARTLRQMVAHRLEADMPVPISQLTWDYRRVPSPDGSNVDIVAQAVRLQRAMRYMTSLSAAHIEVDTLTTEAQAIDVLLQQAIQCPPGSENIALVLADDREWLVALRIDGYVRFTRRLRIGSDVEEGCRQLQQLVAAARPARPLQRILWCGAPEAPAVQAIMQRRLDITLEPATPTDLLTERGGKPITAQQLATFGPAIGLAIAGLTESADLVRLAGREPTTAVSRYPFLERILARPLLTTAVGIGLLVLATVIHVGALATEAHKMQGLLDARNQDNTVLADLQPKLSAMQRLQTYRIDIEAVAADLCRCLPKEIVISSIQLARDRRLIVRGTASDPKVIAKWAEDLAKGDRFANVYPQRTEPDRGGGFTLTAELAGIESFNEAGAPWR